MTKAFVLIPDLFLLKNKCLMNIKSADSVFGSMWIIGSFVGVVLFFQASFYGESWAPFVVAIIIASSGKALLRHYEAQQDKSSPQ